STIYFSAYQLAYDLAKRAERTFQYERGLFAPGTQPFIQPGAWDNLKQGLLAGERLQSNLRAMEAAYLDQNARELELTRHISLQLLNPEQFEALKQSGTCQFWLPEWLFDLDFPGHYMRRLKSVAI